ncbi:pyridoxal phosphate-dependent aminotransferase [bacterium]|nr:pyridoxal phosphate-dependent aminotransferase [bacterium]
MSAPPISERGRLTPESSIRKLEFYAEDAQSRGATVYRLNIGQPDIPTPSEFTDALSKFKENVLAYSRSNGVVSLIESMKAYYHRNGLDHIESKDIMITTGGSEGILFSLNAITSPGDEVIVFEPFYPNYRSFACMAGVRLVPVSTSPETGYHLPDQKMVEEKITSKTKAIIINSPNNPTGMILNRDEIEMMQDIALRHNLFLLSDEVYREFAFDEANISLLSYPKLSQHVIMIDSVSKRYSLCGARIGCIVSKNEEVIHTVLKFGQARLSSPTLEQIAATSVIESGDRYFRQIVQEYKDRRDTLVDGLNQIPGVYCKKPEGAFYLMVTLPVAHAETFCRWLLTDFEEEGGTVMLAPGPGFYLTPDKGLHEARIAYVLNIENLRKSIRILKKGILLYNQS